MSSPVLRTTVYLDADDYRRIKALAQAEGRTAAELVREAVAEYAARKETAARPRTLGAGRSGSGSLSRRAEELLADLGEDG
jgi:predicted transcriptional regulator